MSEEEKVEASGDSVAPPRRKSKIGIKQPPHAKAEEADELYNIDTTPRDEETRQLSVANFENPLTKAEVAIINVDTTTPKNEVSTSITAITSPREVVTKAVANFCDDTIMSATALVSPRKGKADCQTSVDETGGKAPAENCTNSSPRDVVSQIAADVSQKTTTSAADKKVAGDLKKPAASVGVVTADVGSSVEITEITPAAVPKSPREAVDTIAQHAASVTNAAITTASRKLTSPRKPEPESKASGAKKSPAPGAPKDKASPAAGQKKTSPRRAEDKKKAEEAEARALAQAAAFLEAQEKGEEGPGGKDRSHGAAAEKKSSTKKTSAAAPSSEGKKKKAKISQSVHPNVDELPAIRRPSPPAQEKNPRQSDNPRNRKLKPGAASPPPSPKGESNNRLPPISSHPLRDPSRNGKKGARSSENLGMRRESGEEGRPKPQRVGSQSAPIPNEDNLPPIRGARPAKEDEGADERSGGPVKRRKKPLYLRLEDRARKIQIQIDKEKVSQIETKKLCYLSVVR
jgi:hypothetical protein